MSGIDGMKKKVKLSIDEMYDDKAVGQLDNQKDGNTEINQNIQPAIQYENKLDNQTARNPTYQESIQPTNHQAGQTSNHPQESSQKYGSLQSEPGIRQMIVLGGRQQTPKVQTYKMTFNLSEDIYKAFNHLYAQRMIEGRKTEKSELICEAITWLIEMEKNG